MPPVMPDDETEEIIVATEMTCPEKKAGSSSQYVIDSGPSDMECRDDESDGESVASHGKEPGMYGRLMSILEEDYLVDQQDGSTSSFMDDDYRKSDEMESEFTGLETQYLYWKDNYFKADHRGRRRPIQPSKEDEGRALRMWHNWIILSCFTGHHHIRARTSNQRNYLRGL
jgi:hypothetical protein